MIMLGQHTSRSDRTLHGCCVGLFQAQKVLYTPLMRLIERLYRAAIFVSLAGTFRARAYLTQSVELSKCPPLLLGARKSTLSVSESLDLIVLVNN